MRRLVSLLLFFACAASALAAPPPLPDEVRLRAREAFRLADAIGDRIWNGWSRTPFPMVIISGESEWLITAAPAPAKGWTSLGWDRVLRRQVAWRPRKLSASLAATFEENGVPTVFIGIDQTPQQRGPSRWVLTALHEHFHQLQMSTPDYRAAVAGLDLANGDQTGMWMLSYPFPYQSPELNEGFAAAGRLLVKMADGAPGGDYAAQRRRLTATSAADARYLEFQVWQEGVAMYTEYRVAEWAARHFRPSRDYGELAAKVLLNIRQELANLPLSNYKRVAFYYLGAGEALAADRIAPGWREQYLARRFRGPLSSETELVTGRDAR